MLTPPLHASERKTDPVLAWNECVLTALKQDATAPLLVARSLAIVHLAIWEAQKDADAAKAEFAITQAGCITASALLPGHRAEFESLRDKTLAQRDGSATGREGMAIGEAAARRVLEQRANDGSAIHVSYIPRSEPGQWRRTAPFFRPPELPQWADRVRPFVLDRPDQLRPAGPPVLASAEWGKAFDEVKLLGGKESKTRTAEQSVIAKFWSDFSYTETPPGHWNSIVRTLVAQRKLTTAESAKLFAALNTAMMDAGIACWDAKYHYNFWRPVTAIPRAAEDANAATAPDEKWTPLLTTPAHPEYPSGHSTFSGAAVVVLVHFLGGDAVDLTVRSDGLPNLERRFTSLRACAEECGASRVYGGIHYRFSCDDGMRLGQTVATWILSKQKVKP